MDKLKMHSPDMTALNIEKIAALFPNCITESANKQGGLKQSIDFDLLKQELSASIVDGPQERYHLNWPGKREALLTANAPIAKTLRPCREESVNFDNTENLFIEGDNLDALKLLQETYLGRVKMIYIDPPYNTGNDFIYEDDFAENSNSYLLRTNQVDENKNKLVTNSDANGRFHSDWLSMMYQRIKLAFKFLDDDGVMFISIDENEISNLKLITNEIFGEFNHITTLHIQMSSVQGQKVKAAKQGNIVKNAEYILVYGKTGKKNIAKNVLYEPCSYDTHYSLYIEAEDDYYLERSLGSVLAENDEAVSILKKLDLIKKGNVTNKAIAKAYSLSDTFKALIHKMSQNIVCDDKSTDIKLPEGMLLQPGKVIKYQSDTRDYLITINSNGNYRQRIRLSEKINQADNFLKDYGCTNIRGDWWPEFHKDMGNVSKEGDVTYSNGKKPIRLIKQLAYMVGCSNSDIVLDFFAGSATTQHAIMSYNAEYGCNVKVFSVQYPELLDPKKKEQKQGYNFCKELGLTSNVCEISKERIKRSAKKILMMPYKDTWNKDVGFRVLKIDTSNMADVHYNPEQTSQGDMFTQVENIKEKRGDEDLLFQVLLDWGVGLTLPISKQQISDKVVFFVNGDSDGEGADLIACFAKNITDELVSELAKLQPLRVVFRDDGFKTDAVKINAEQIFKQLSPATDVKSI